MIQDRYADHVLMHFQGLMWKLTPSHEEGMSNIWDGHGQFVIGQLPTEIATKAVAKHNAIINSLMHKTEV